MIANNYKIIKKIGEGSSGKVYLSEKNGNKFAIKKINVTNFSKKEKNYLISEIIIQQKHNSDYIIKLLDLFFQNNYIYIISEYACNGTLGQYIKNNPKISPNLINKWLLQIAIGLKYLHDNNIIHRDLKCENVFLDSNFDVKIGDLGIVKILFQKKFAITNIGTPYFMSPELFKGSFYNHKTDIWSLGCILYQLLTSKLPFCGANIIQLSNNIKYKDFNRHINNKFKEDYLYILDRLLDKNYKTRCNLCFIYNNTFLKKNLSDTNFIHHFSKTIMNLNIIGELEPINNWNLILDKVYGNKNDIKSIRSIETKYKTIEDQSCFNSKNKMNLKPLNNPPPIPERDYPTDTILLRTDFLYSKTRDDKIVSNHKNCEINTIPELINNEKLPPIQSRATNVVNDYGNQKMNNRNDVISKVNNKEKLTPLQCKVNEIIINHGDNKIVDNNIYAKKNKKKNHLLNPLSNYRDIQSKQIKEKMILKRNNKLQRLRNLKCKKYKKSTRVQVKNKNLFIKYKKINHAKYIRYYKKNYVSPYSDYNKY